MTEQWIKHEKLVTGVLKYDHLIGIPFEHGVNDCYTIIQRLFWDNLRIKLADYARPNDWWLKDDMDLYRDNFKREGFQIVDAQRLEDIRPLDCFLIAIPDPRDMSKTKTNHAAAYVGNGMILHHRFGMLSERRPYRETIRNLTTHIIRHRDVPDMSKSTMETLNLMDHILPHKREILQRAIDEANKPK